MYLRHVPCHVVQRGVNRQPTFFSSANYCYYLDSLAEACTKHGVALHAYVLMTNHVHLLMTPREQAEGISRVMQSLGRRYVYHVNNLYERTGTLWESRHKASLVESDGYLLACSRYIELNPVRAGMVVLPEDYRWSSYASNALGTATSCPVEPHPTYLGLGDNPSLRHAAYRELFSTAMDPGQQQAIRKAISTSLPCGDHRFREQVEHALGRKLGYAHRGRPRGRAGNKVTDPF